MHDPVFSTKLFYFDLVIVFVAYTDSYQTIWEKNAIICFSDCKDFLLIIKHTTHVLINRSGKACYEETFDAITLFSLPCPPLPPPKGYLLSNSLQGNLEMILIVLINSGFKYGCAVLLTSDLTSPSNCYTFPYKLVKRTCCFIKITPHSL